jgi:hypothetical protein
MAINGIDELTSSDDGKPPVISYGLRIRRGWTVVAEDYLDWDLGQF